MRVYGHVCGGKEGQCDIFRKKLIEEIIREHGLKARQGALWCKTHGD